MKITGFFSCLIFAAFLIGCGAPGGAGNSQESTDRPKKIGVTLDGRLTAANVAIRIAERRGYFEDVGLDVLASDPVFPRRSVPYVADEIDDFGIAQEPQVVMGKEKGDPIVAVGSLVSEPTAAIVWLKGSKIQDIADLRGKTIAVPGSPFQRELLGSVLARAGLTMEDVEVRRVGYKLVPSLLNGRADAIFGASWNIEGLALEARGAKPIVKRVQDLGIPAYEEQVVITHVDRVREDPQSIRAFMSAVVRGLAAARNEPNVAIKFIDRDIESSPEVDRFLAEAQYRATLPLFTRNGRMDSAEAARLIEWMHDKGLIGREVQVSTLFTNEFLPANTDVETASQ